MSSATILNLPRRFLRMCRRRWKAVKAVDSTGVKLTGSDLLIRALVLRRLLRRDVLAKTEEFVGILLPPSVGSLLVNAALSIDRRVTVNLNYTVSPDVMNDSIRQCGIRHVISSRRVLERFPFPIDADYILLEECLTKVRRSDKIISYLLGSFLPVSLLERFLKLTSLKDDDLLTLIFTSGSTGQPKGVMLTHKNIASNVEGVDQLIRLDDHDALLGILPFFHAFGYTTTLWTVLTMGPKGVYHYSPLEAREIGGLCRREGVTILVATPTFARSYLKRCEVEDFARLEVGFLGAEKMPIELADAFEAKYGIRLREGYGATELSPVVAGNVPEGRGVSREREGVKEGTVGRPLPNVKVKIVDLETGEDLGANQQGMLLVGGPGVMKGYYKKPELTASVLRDGWYITGDVAEINEEGFIRITGRISRFSKIGGEMVPHIRIEEELLRVLNWDGEDIILAVTSIADPRKGERLVVLHCTEIPSPDILCRALARAGLPMLWIPSVDSFRRVDELPLLGTGKLDLHRLKEMAESLFMQMA